MDQRQRRPRAAIYCRISDDREGERLGVERQRQDCLERAEREGWDVVEVFTDNDVGASTRSRKPRPAYKRMTKAAEDGAVDVILAYSASRLTRRPLELEQLISLHECRGVLLRTIVSGDTNLATADGRAVARTLAAWDAAEAERIGERVARAARQRREQGLRHGGFPPYGYANGEGGRLVIHPERAAVVREAARRVLNGESLYGVWMDLNHRGIRTGPSPKAKDGARWHGRTLKRVLTAPATIGCVQADNGELRVVAEPILDRPTWERLREVLYDSQRFTETQKPDWSNRRKYALSGLLYCGAPHDERDQCGHWLSGSMRPASVRKDGQERPKVKTFMCASANGGCGKLRIDYAALERWVLSQVFARLDVPGVQTALSTREEPGDDDELRQQIADRERRLEKLDDDHTDGVLDRRRYLRQVERVTREIDALRHNLAASQRVTFVIDTNGRSLRDAWDEHGHDVAWRRTFLEHVIDRVTILPHPAGMTSTLTRRRRESDESLESRRKEHQELILFLRVRILWKS